MSTGVHNASSKASVCLADRQGGANPLYSESVRHRFWAKVQKTPGCWLWTASKSGGRGGRKWYGQFTITGAPRTQRHIGAHVFSYELAHGPVPDGLEVMHTCDVPHCVNPSHLTVGTHAENNRDAAAKGRLSVPRPSRHKVTDAQVEDIIALVRSGIPRYRVAERFGVSKAFVGMLVAGTRRQLREAASLRRSA